MGRKWTEAEVNELINLRGTLPVREICAVLDRPLEGVKSKIHELVKSTRLCNLKHGWTESELLSSIKLWPNSLDYDFNTKNDPNYPSKNSIIRHFGTWNKALSAAGLDYSCSGMKRNTNTILYLIFFKEEQFYKLGITQSSLYRRFNKRAYPEYSIIDTIEYSNLADAFETEKELKQLIKAYNYQPILFGPSGHTECFKATSQISCLEDIYNL